MASAMASYRVTAHVAAPPDRVFDLWVDLDRMKDWVRGVTKVTDVSGPVAQAGTRYVVWFSGMKSPTEVLEAERPRVFRTKFGNWILRGEGGATFEPEGDGTRIVQDFRTEGWIAAVSSWLFSRGSYEGSFQGELNTFAKLAEREAGATQ